MSLEIKNKKKEKNVIKRKIRRKNDESSNVSRELRMYFNNDTQNALIEYQNLSRDSKKEKEIIYVNKILPAFQKLVENLINIHKFSSLYDSYDDLKNDCVNFLFETIYKFDASRGSNAFSYFNVVAKNWLIIKTKQKSIKIKKNLSIEDTSSLSPRDITLIEEWNIIASPFIENDQEEVPNIDLILNVLNEIKEKTRSENEKACINAIIVIFKNIDNIDLLNKSAVLLYIRELSGLNPKQLTMTMQTIKKYYKKIKNDIRNRAA